MILPSYSGDYKQWEIYYKHPRLSIQEEHYFVTRKRQGH